jgi:hypothetical protein
MSDDVISVFGKEGSGEIIQKITVHFYVLHRQIDAVFLCYIIYPSERICGSVMPSPEEKAYRRGKLRNIRSVFCVDCPSVQAQQDARSYAHHDNSYGILLQLQLQLQLKLQLKLKLYGYSYSYSYS